MVLLSGHCSIVEITCEIGYYKSFTLHVDHQADAGFASRLAFGV